MPSKTHSDDDYAAEAFELDSEASPKKSSFENGVRRDYHHDELEGDLENDYLAGEETEDDRAILLRDLNESNLSRISDKTTEYDASDDSAAAMVHRVSRALVAKRLLSTNMRSPNLNCCSRLSPKRMTLL